MNLQVKDYQSQPAVLSLDAAAYDALVALFVHNIGSIFIVDEQQALQGVVSRKDLLKVAMGQSDMHKMPVGMVMTRMPNLIMTTENECIWDAARKLISHEIDALPVVRQDGKEQWKVVGRFTKTNVTRAFVELGYGKVL